MDPEKQEVLDQEPLEPTGEVETPAIEDAAIESESDSSPESEVAPAKQDAVTDELPDKVQKRIDEVIWQKHEAQRERDYWKMQAEKQARFVEPDAVKPAVVPQLAPAPRQEDFETYEAYDEALFDWRFQHRQAQQKAESERSMQERRQQEFAEQARSWAEKGQEKYPDFARVALREPADGGPQISQFMAGAIQDSEMGHEVAYYLGQHPKEAARIAKLSAIAQVREIGRLEIKVTSPIQKETTKAPTPTAPVGGKESPSKRLEDMSYEEYKTYRLSQLGRGG